MKPSNLQPARILVIEDNATNRSLMVYLLQSFGYETIEAIDGEEGVARARASTPDLIICDINLPKLDGFGVVQVLGHDEKCANIPVVAVTALAMVGDRERILKADFRGYLSKPITPETFVREMEAFLPREKVVSIPSAKKVSAKQKTANPGQTILVVDDREDNRMMIKAMLAGEGFRFIEADSGVTALKAISRERPDVIICDILMPKMDGFEFVRELRRDQKRAAIPVAFMTASYLENEARELARVCGVKEVLTSPFSPEMMRKAVESALGAKPAAVAKASPDFDAAHRRLVNEKLAQKVEDFDRLTKKLQEEIIDRAAAQRQLEALEHRHTLIIDSAGDGIVELDGHCAIVSANPKACELLGWEEEELRGKVAHNVWHSKRPDGSPYPMEECPICASAANGRVIRVRGDTFWRKNGSAIRVDFVAAPIRDKRGRDHGHLLTLRDSSEDFAIEARLRLQREQYRMLFHVNPNPMWIYDVDSQQVLAANDAAVREYGFSAKEFLDLKLSDLQSESPLKSSRKEKSEADAPKTYTHRRKDGSLLFAEVYSSPIIWESTAACMLMAINVTARHDAEARLRAQADIINRAHDAVVVRDFESDLVRFWNKGAESLFGWPESEAVGRRMGDLFVPDPKARRVAVDQLAATGEYRGEFRLTARGGRKVICEVRASLIRDDSGRPDAVLNIFNDVTEKRALEMHLLRSQRLESLGTLASGVAHDLNNILTPILMSAEVLRNGPAGKESKPVIDLITESARRGSNIVTQVLAFARGMEGEHVSLRPNHLIEEMVGIAQETFPKSVEVRSRYPEDLWSIEGDPTQLHQVLLNLSVNARDAMPHGGSLVISAENFTVDQQYVTMRPEAKVGPYVVLHVTDSGEGIPREMLEKIFDPFFTSKEVGKGTGLGLSTSMGIVKSHGGFISVESEPGRGTNFSVYLPAQFDRIAKSKADSLPPPPSGHGEMILVVDDEEGIREMSKMVLESANYRPVLARDGLEGLALFAMQREECKVVLSDILMPHMSGLDMLRAISRIKPEVSMVVLSGQGELNVETDAKALGATYLSKPCDARTLLNALHHVLSKPPGISEDQRELHLEQVAAESAIS